MIRLDTINAVSAIPKPAARHDAILVAFRMHVDNWERLRIGCIFAHVICARLLSKTLQEDK